MPTLVESARAFIVTVTPRIVAPTGMDEKSNPYAFNTSVWSLLSKVAAVTLASPAP